MNNTKFNSSTLSELQQAVLAFRDERDWKQFHTLRHLIVSLNLEAAELLELTQWKRDEEVAALPQHAEGREALSDECADVLMYLLLVANEAGIDLGEAVRSKLIKNARKYPVEAARGVSTKYDRLPTEAVSAGVKTTREARNSGINDSTDDSTDDTKETND